MLPPPVYWDFPFPSSYGSTSMTKPPTRCYVAIEASGLQPRKVQEASRMAMTSKGSHGIFETWDVKYIAICTCAVLVEVNTRIQYSII